MMYLCIEKKEKESGVDCKTKRERDRMSSTLITERSKMRKRLCTHVQARLCVWNRFL